MRRLGFVLALLAIGGLTAYGEGLFDRQHLAYYIFYRDEGSVIDSTDSKVLAYATYHADTTGHSVAATYADTTWYWTNITWDIYDVYWDSSGTVELLADNILIPARVLGDTTITDTLVFGADCVPGYAIIDDAIEDNHIADDALKVNHYDAGSIDSAAINGQEIGNAHMDMTEQFNFMRLDVDSIGVRDSSVTWMDAVDPDSIVLPTSAVSGVGLNITSGKVDIDTAPSSGAATLIEEEDALQVKYDTNEFDEDAVKGLGLKEDGVTTDALKDSNAPAADDHATYAAGAQINWQTSTEMSLPVVVGSGYTDMAVDATHEWDVYVSGALTSDDCLCSFSGPPPQATGMEIFVYTVGCTVAVADTITFQRAPDTVLTPTSGDLTLFWLLLRNP